MSESFYLRIAGEDFEATNENTSLQTYVAHLAMHDNVILQRETPATEKTESTLIFKESESYEKLKELIEQHKFPQYLNMPKVTEGIAEAYASQFIEDFNTIPEGWV